MIIKPYGDTLNDGAVQFSFTLPVSAGLRADEAAKQFVIGLGFNECEVCFSKSLSENFTFFVVYGKTDKGINWDNIKVDETASEFMDFYEINDFIKEKIGRKIVVVGACTGFDAHTVGIDAIMNMKGYDHHYGLERYPMVEAYNLGAQVSNEKLIEFAKKVNADAILVSQIVTQKDVHIQNLTEFVEMVEAEKIREKTIIVAGGPRINAKLAMELGFDMGFGKGCFAEHVATFIVKKMAERQEK
ncbi:MAG: OAM dimerization domain-containing protein [Candidatus Muiribacteriota bacterium]|jgi:beta-lysine 5,6-aminomutase beta subunit